MSQRIRGLCCFRRTDSACTPFIQHWRMVWEGKLAWHMVGNDSDTSFELFAIQSSISSDTGLLVIAIQGLWNNSED